MNRLWLTGTAAVAAFLVGTAASAIAVQSTDSVYDYSGALGPLTGSTIPKIVSLGSGTNRVLYFSVSGSVSLTPLPEPYGPHGPDGGPQAFDMNVDAANGLSGVHSTNVGYLAGVFLNGSEPSNSVPATSDFTNAGTGEDFSSLSPAIDQVFYIGDGLTSTGVRQSFTAPVSATELVLGIVDAGGYNGPPGAYFDNSGSYSVDLVTPGVPEPASWAMFIGGFGLVGSAMRHRRTAVILV